MKRVAILAVLALTACAHTASTVTMTCVARPAYTAAQEQAIGNAIAALPPDSALIGLAADYTQVLKEIDACNAGEQPVKGITP